MPDHTPDPAPDPRPDQPPEQARHAAPDPGQDRDGRARLLAALHGRPSRGQVVGALLLALLGFAGAVQVSTVNSDTPYAGARRDDLVQLLQSLSAAQDRASRQFEELQNTQQALQDSTDQRTAALQEARRELDSLQILAGATGATGPGVSVTIDDPTGSVGAATLLNAIEELRDAGAEAIEVNDTARVVAQTALGDGSDLTDGELVVGNRAVTAPYAIEAIGAPQTLSEAVVFPGGLSDEVEALGGTVAVDTSDEIRITSLAAEAGDDFVEPSV